MAWLKKRSMNGLCALIAALHIAISAAPDACAVEPLTDAIMTRMFPVLRSLGETMQARPAPGSVRAAREKEAAESYLALVDSMKAGTVDPLDWLKKHAPGLRIPPLIAYGPECSRLATGLSMRPTAVFSFGIEASEYGLSVVMPSRGEKNGNTAGPDDTQAQRKVRGIVNAMQSYYHDEGFPGFANDAPLYWTTVSRDSTVSVTVIEANIYLPWGCASMPTGPVLELALNVMSTGAGEPSAKDRDAGFRSPLSRSGVGEDEILPILTALATARKDSRDPSLLVLDDSAPPDTEEGKKLFEQVKKMVAVRKANLHIYRQYAKTIDPILDMLEKE